VSYDDVGQGVPMVLLHANPGDRRDFAGIVPSLARTHRVLAIDWPGYGESPAPAESASAFLFAGVLRDWLERLALPPAILVGNSVGGFAALSVALERPELARGVVLVNSGGFTRHNLFTRTFTRAKGTEWLTRRIAGRFARHYLKRRNEITEAMIARADAEQNEPARVAVDAAVWRSFLDARHDLRAQVAKLKVPSLLVWGRHDPVLRIDRDGEEARRALGCEMIAMDTGHAPFAEDADAFLAAIAPTIAEWSRDARAAREAS
jgi:pimeloyl-ACP methyl ester carboxylesterase